MSRLRRRRPSPKCTHRVARPLALSALRLRSASRHRTSPRRCADDHGDAPTAAVSVTGSPSTSHSTAALAPCHRSASDSRDAGPATRPWASKSRPRHRSRMPPGNRTRPATSRRSTAGITATSPGARLPSAVPHRGLVVHFAAKAGQVGERPALPRRGEHDAGGVEGGGAETLADGGRRRRRRWRSAVPPRRRRGRRASPRRTSSPTPSR